MHRSPFARLIPVGVILLSVCLSPPARAIGGHDQDPLNQTDRDTQRCQSEIAKRGAKLAAKWAEQVRVCLDAALRCDEKSDASSATQCRRKLLVPGQGRCSEGRLDLGTALIGPGAAAHARANAGSSAKLLKELNKFLDSLARRCSDADTSDDASGLGFGDGLSSDEVGDLANDASDGLGCLANGLVLASAPRANAALALLASHHETCVEAGAGAALGDPCSVGGDADCGSGGRCGRLAATLRGGPGGVGLDPCARELCEAGLASCSGWCRDLALDPDHCGACENACGDSEICAASTCTACPAGQVRCGNVCSDPQTDDQNCGSCGLSCAGAASCNAGLCETAGGIWQPAPGTSWQWQLQGALDSGVDVAMYDIDLFDTPAATIANLTSQGRVVVCYFSAGSFEDFRPDSASFPESVKGNTLSGFPDERWLDIRDLTTLAPILRARLDLAASKGCVGVEPDNVDGYANNSGFPLNAGDQLTFNQFLADEAHLRGLSVGLKNDLDQVPQLVGSFDWALNEQCVQFSECDALDPFVAAGKAVFGVEYQGNPASFCPPLNAKGFSWLKKNLSLDAFRIDCADFP